MRLGVVAGIAAAAVVALALLLWRGPDLGVVEDAFTAVAWQWVAAAIGINLASVWVRTVAWQVVIAGAMPRPRPRFRAIFSAFSIGLLANAVIPGRIGEVARVAVLVRRLPAREGRFANLAGTVFAHRVFDLVAVALLVLWVVAEADIPRWAITSLIALVAVGVALLMVGIASARRHHLAVPDELGRFRRLLASARTGLGVMRSPLGSAAAIVLQCAAWTLQLFAVWAAMRAFQIEEPLAAAGLVLVLMNVAGLFPLWPGNVGLVQAAVALPLVAYGIDYAHGFAFGIGLQAIEASVGVGLGLLFLAREGLSFATLRQMPDADEPAPVAVADGEPAAPRRRRPERVAG